jgi:hypothetical protein
VTTLPAASTSPTATATGTSGGDASTEPPPPACNGADCPCATGVDCKDATRRYCGPSKTCVECVKTPADTCTAGGYCNDQNQCMVGCKGVGDCPAGLECESKSHRCVECTKTAECADAGSGKVCSPSGRCVATCAVDGTVCGVGMICCSNLCLSLDEDVLNCGACGVACSTNNGTPTCAAGKCTWSCANGYAHCDTTQPNSGCETSTRTIDNCGTCGTKCTSALVVNARNIACDGTKCTYGSCNQGHYDQDNDPSNGCESSCGNKNQTCCPKPEQECNDGNNCRTSNNTCPP